MRKPSRALWCVLMKLARVGVRFDRPERLKRTRDRRILCRLISGMIR
jgi:hypothetical protein